MCLHLYEFGGFVAETSMLSSARLFVNMTFVVSFSQSFINIFSAVTRLRHISRQITFFLVKLANMLSLLQEKRELT